MRKLKLQMQITADGFVAGPNGEMDWMISEWDEDLNDYVREITEQVDCILLGRKLAEGFIPYWASYPENEDFYGIEKMNQTPKVVFTKTLETSEWENTVLAKGDFVDEITQLKKQNGKDIIVYGGATFVSALIKNGLIDEFYLFLNPVKIENGLTIFDESPAKQNLNLVKSTSFDCGIVVLQYEKSC